MGQRHNRKRTRSRPRNRRSNNHARDSSVDSSFSAFSTFSAESSFRSGLPSYPHLQHYSTFSNPPAAHWHQQYSAWHVRQELQRRQQEEVMEKQRLRMFGGEAADGAELCAPMLKVVMDLFDDIDYIDP